MGARRKFSTARAPLVLDHRSYGFTAGQGFYPAGVLTLDHAVASEGSLVPIRGDLWSQLAGGISVCSAMI